MQHGTRAGDLAPLAHTDGGHACSQSGHGRTACGFQFNMHEGTFGAPRGERMPEGSYVSTCRLLRPQCAVDGHAMDMG